MALVICPDCNKTRIPNREQIEAKDYCQCFATIAIYEPDPPGVFTEHISETPIEPHSFRVESASNGESDKCDIVILFGEGEVLRHKNLIMECLHEETKVYSGDSPESWICSMCGHLGGVPLKRNPEPDGSEFRRLWKLFGHGE